MDLVYLKQMTGFRGQYAAILRIEYGSSDLIPGRQSILARSRLSHEVAARHGDEPSLFLFYRVVFAFQPCRDGRTLESGTEEYLKVAGYFEKVGQKVPWQKLKADFQDETFRFQVLDEGENADRDWRDDLKKLLESAV